MNRPSWIGQTLGGRYRIDEIIGQGGMSAVYKAYDPNLKRVVAVKLIHSHLADDPKFLTRFEEEAAAVAQLRHSNIVQVYDFNHDGDLYYMVQEFVPGETLQERLRRLNRAGQRMPVEEAIRIARQIGEAAGFAHRRGMIHRDIKPANIILDVYGQAILMDFGIVKIMGGERHTATGAVVGTALYLPPEVIRGETADPRSDLYSLGVTLYEIVSGRPPFEADSAMTLMMMHLKDPVPDLRQLRPEVPEELIQVIEKALAKDREARYASMEALSAALQGILDGVKPAPLPVELEHTLKDEPSPGTSPAGQTLQAAGLASPGSGTAHSTPARSSGTVPPASLPPATGSPPGALGAGAQPEPVGATFPPPTRRVAAPVIWAGGVALLLLFALGGVLISRGLNRGGAQPPVSGAAVLPSHTPPAAALLAATDTLSPTPSLTPTFTPELPPTETPAPTLSPTPTIPVGVPYAIITGITVDEQNRYVVDYETFEFTEKISANTLHVHFFFNNVPPEQAGHPGNGPWILYGGPSPFTEYFSGNRPKDASQMCILVTNPDHSVQPNSGNCFNLPDIVAAVPIADSACLTGPGETFPPVVTVKAGQVLVVQGISADEGWWNVARPQSQGETCWLPLTATTFGGDISTLPLVEAPPVPAGPSVQIQGITVDDQNRYVVTYTTQGFTEKLPGTHIHFFFDTVSPEQVGMDGGGNRRMWGGPTPFSGYGTADRPDGATGMCALVANPDHSIILSSGNCFPLPGTANPY